MMSFVCFNVSFNKLLLYCSISILLLEMATAGTIAPSVSASRNLFAADTLKAIALERTAQNVVFSPASIQTALTLCYFGAKGPMANELRTALKLGALENAEIARNYGDFLKKTFKSTTNGPQLQMSNRIYVNENLKVVPAFNQIASDHFDSQAEKLKMNDAAVKKINSWVAKETENKIQNLLQPGAVGQDTSVLLVNAIYFKAKWAKPFSVSSTYTESFELNARESVPVDMMSLDDKFKYADLKDLDATAVELPYENSDLSMLIVLPNKVEGLKALEEKLAHVDLNELTHNKLQEADVNVFLPKFRIEFDIDLKEPLTALGMPTMFSDAADLSNLLDTQTPQRVSDVKHKAYLNVNEAGSEAAAATFIKIVTMCLNLDQKIFRANHPFFFAIRNNHAVYFAGHLVKF